MRILRIDGWDGPTLGGAEVYIGRVSRALEAQGHPNLTAAIVTDPPAAALGPARVFRVSSSSARQAMEGFTQSLPLQRWLEALAGEFRPDVIHLHHFRAGFPGLAAWLSHRTEPVVFTAHDVEVVCPIATLTLPDGSACPGGILPRCQFTGCDVGFGLPLNLLERYYFDRFVKPRIHCYICVSMATQHVFENLGYRPTALLRPMIPVPPQPVSAPEGPFTIGYLGRYDAQKGLDVLLRAFAVVRQSLPDARLRCGGSGPFVLPRSEGLTDDGWVANASDWFARIHVLVVPSLGWENLGNSPIEALGHGLPVVVSNSGGLPETVGRYGTVVPQGDASVLAKTLLALWSDYPRARQAAVEGREWVRQEFSPDAHLARLMQIYSRART